MATFSSPATPKRTTFSTALADRSLYATSTTHCRCGCTASTPTQSRWRATPPTASGSPMLTCPAPSAYGGPTSSSFSRTSFGSDRRPAMVLRWDEDRCLWGRQGQVLRSRLYVTNFFFLLHFSIVLTIFQFLLFN